MPRNTKLNIICILLFIVGAFNPAFAGKVSVSNNGKAVLPIIVKGNGDSMKQAKILADYLGEISGATFKIENNKTNGIILGLSKEFPQFKKLFDSKDPLRSDEYLIKSVDGSIYLVGVSNIALGHAVWDFLYRLGHRQFFPTKSWEIIPSMKNISVDIDVFEKPDYYIRAIFFGYGSWKENMQRFYKWETQNRMDRKCRLNTNHSYQRMIQQYKKEFTKHPEYYGLYKGKRCSHKVCVSNLGVQKIALDFAKNFFIKNPNEISVSMEPSDGWKWCECKNCAKIGSITDRAVFLANYVANGLRKDPRFKYKYVGMLAYNQHSPPPTKKLAPNVIVCIATAFIHGGYTFEDLLDEWSKKADIIGVYDYFSVTTWDRDIPAKARGSNLDYLSEKIVGAYRKKARFYTAESSDNWGPCGLGYYISSRLMWDADPAKIKIWEKDFYDKAFGPAAKTMEKFYTLISRKSGEPISPDLMGKMFRLLDKATKEASGTPAVEKRIGDLVLYAHYVELFQKYITTQGAPRQVEFENMLKFAYRTHYTMMVHAIALFRDIHIRDKQVDIVKKKNCWNLPASRNSWKNETPFSKEEIAKMLTEGIKNNAVIEYKKRSYDKNYVPSGAAPKRRGSLSMLSGKYQFYIWADNKKLPQISAKAGVVSKNKGNAKWKLYNANGKLVQSGEIVADNTKHLLQFKPWGKGLYRLEYDDKGMFTYLTWPAGSKVCLLADSKNRPKIYGASNFRFYVPKGLKKVVLYMKEGSAHVFNAKMHKVLSPSKKQYQLVEIPVKPGDDDQIWNIQCLTGIVILKNIPPLLALNEDELLIPKECLKKDTK